LYGKCCSIFSFIYPVALIVCFNIGYVILPLIDLVFSDKLFSQMYFICHQYVSTATKKHPKGTVWPYSMGENLNAQLP